MLGIIITILFAFLLPYVVIRTYLEARKMKQLGANISPLLWAILVWIFFLPTFLIYEAIRKRWERQTQRSAKGAFEELSQMQRILCIIIYFVLLSIYLYIGLSLV